MNDTHTEDVEGLLDTLSRMARRHPDRGRQPPTVGNGPGPDPAIHGTRRSARVRPDPVDRGVHGAAARAEAPDQERPGAPRAGRGHDRRHAPGHRAVPVGRAQGGSGRLGRRQVLAEALGDLDEALDRGRREIEKASRRIVEESTQALVDALDRAVPPASRGSAAG